MGLTKKIWGGRWLRHDENKHLVSYFHNKRRLFGLEKLALTYIFVRYFFWPWIVAAIKTINRVASTSACSTTGSVGVTTDSVHGTPHHGVLEPGEGGDRRGKPH